MAPAPVKVVKTARFSVLGLPSETDVKVSAASPASAPAKSSAPVPVKAPEKAQKNESKKSKKGTSDGNASGKKGSQPKPTRPWTDEMQVDFDRILSVGEECISEPELKNLILSKGRGSDSDGFVLYDGFEPSGRMHIAQGVFKAMNVNKCTVEGTNSTFVFWVADWFALMNDKMGGDLDKIKIVGKYLIEVWKAAGMDLSHVVFKWTSEEITKQATKYWPTMLHVASKFNITRVKKCCQIMGRLEGSLTAAQVLYPLMQCTDIFFLHADICQLGVDQRKVNMLAREYCDAAGIKHKPIILSHHMLFGLKAGQEKMSKSDPDSAVFMEDAPEDIERKIQNAYCPIKPADETTTEAGGDEQDAGKESMHLTEDKLKNPCLDYIHHIIFSPPGAKFTAGSKTFSDFEAVKDAFLAGELSESELKSGLVSELNRMLAPVREHFTTDETAKELLAQVRQFKKEASTTVVEKKLKRLDLVTLGKAPAGCHLVFAPLPTANPSLQCAINVLSQIRQAGDKPCVFYMSDWSARVTNACGGDVKSIAAFYPLLVASMKALDPKSMEKVSVVLQSEAILADPSNYWISVINAGRHFQLNDVMGPKMKDSEGVGIVIGRLMMIADVLAVGPASLSVDKDFDVEKMLVERFFKENVAGSMATPDILTASAASIRLQPEREMEAHATPNDEYFLMDDPKVNGKSKMKKAFCEPGNVSFCPPISLSTVFTFDYGEGSAILVKRSEDNGGDVAFESLEALEKSFMDGSLHPGDLKAYASGLMVQVLEKLAGSIKSDSDAFKGTKVLKALQKKMAKGKK